MFAFSVLISVYVLAGLQMLSGYIDILLARDQTFLTDIGGLGSTGLSSTSNSDHPCSAGTCWLVKVVTVRMLD